MYSIYSTHAYMMVRVNAPANPSLVRTPLIRTRKKYTMQHKQRDRNMTHRAVYHLELYFNHNTINFCRGKTLINPRGGGGGGVVARGVNEGCEWEWKGEGLVSAWQWW